jgi:hypothetical protein
MTPILNVARVLREKLGENGAEALVELINQANGQAKVEVLTFVEEKFERRLSEEGAKLDRRITEEGAKLDVKISETKADLLRWMFIFWIGQVGALLGILFAFFRR